MTDRNGPSQRNRGVGRMRPTSLGGGLMSWALLAGILLGAGAASAQPAAPDQSAVPPGMRHRVLNLLDQGTFLELWEWQVSEISVSAVEDIAPRLGIAALRISGRAQTEGAKVDGSAFAGTLDDCHRLSLWVQAPPNANVASVGLQLVDAEGEWFMQTVPLDWEGWKRVDVDPTAGGMKQAWAQDDKNGKVDQPLRDIHVICFAGQAGPISLYVNGLTALVSDKSGQTGGLHMVPIPSSAIEPGRPLNLRPMVENRGDQEQSVTVNYSLRLNASYVDPVVPDPILGYNLAVGVPSTVSVDGADPVDARLTDGDDLSFFETPWGGNYKELVATIDLGQARPVTAVHWLPGDANWIFQADLSTSLDGTTFAPVTEAQDVPMYHKWATEQAFPWPGPLETRYLRIRFHNNGQASQAYKLPPAIVVYDGIANDSVKIPETGAVLFSGTATVKVPPRDFAELRLVETQPLTPGSYLLGMDMDMGGRRQVGWSHLLVAPDSEVPPDRARRFGFNGATARFAQSMRRCGFGWVRFENAKWSFYALSPDEFSFDGRVKPWVVDIDAIFGGYAALGINVLPYVFMPPEWQTTAPADVRENRGGYPPKDPAAYGEAIFQLVARFGTKKVDPSQLKTQDRKSGLGLIQAVELWNEPNLNAPSWGPFVGTMAQYFELMRVGVEAARRADPTLPVSAAGLAGIDLAVIGQLAEYHYADGKTPLDLVDIINGHFYSGRQEPELSQWDPNADREGAGEGGTSYPQQLAELVAWRDRLKPQAEIWLTETGNDVGGPIGLSERHQAAKLPRVVMLALAAGIEKVFIYRESGSTPAQHAGAGLLRNDGSMRPSWVTVATMIRQLQGFEGRALRLPADDPQVWMFLWQDGDRQVLSAWTLGEEIPLGIDLGDARVCDAFGHVQRVGNTSQVRLSYFPTYIALAGKTPALTGLIDKAHALLKQREQQFRQLAEMRLYLFDFGSAEHVGMLKGYGPARRFTPVGPEDVWSDDAGFGFALPAISENDRPWIVDPLERDDCRIMADNSFRMRLAPGRYTVRVSAAAVAQDPTVEVILAAGDQAQRQTVTRDHPVAQFTVVATAQPVSVSLGDIGALFWISAIPEDAREP